MTNNAYITFGEVLAALLGACAIGWIAKWGSSALLVVLIGHRGADDPSNWDLIRLISIYSGIAGGALFGLWLLSRRKRMRRSAR